MLRAEAQLIERQTGNRRFLVQASPLVESLVSLSMTLYQQLSSVQNKKTGNCPDMMGTC